MTVTQNKINGKTIISRSNNLPNEGNYLDYDIIVLQDGDYNLSIYDAKNNLEIEIPNKLLPHLIRMFVNKMERNSQNYN